MSTIVAVEGFKLKGKHGVFDYEREKEQPFVVSIWALLKEPAKDDEIETGVDYAFLQRTVHDVIVRGEPVHMMETLCDRIIEIVSATSMLHRSKSESKNHKRPCHTTVDLQWLNGLGPKEEPSNQAPICANSAS